MKTSSSAFAKAFTEDHKHVTRGFWKLRKALEAGDIPEARRIAETLDRRAGPHIEFEEAVFYPLMREFLADEYVDRLYAEHRVGRAVLVDVQTLEPGKPLSDAACDALLRQTRTALDHAVSCGTLLSHVEALDESRQDAMLAQLVNFRGRGHRWTQLNA